MTTQDQEALAAAGAMLKAARGRRQLSRTAQQIGVSETKYEAMERGHYPNSRPVKATLKEYTAAARVLGVNLDALLNTLHIEHTEDVETAPAADAYALGKLLRAAREKLGVSQRGLTERYMRSDGLSYSMLSKYETGDALPSLGTVPVLSRMYGLPEPAIMDALVATQHGRVDLRLPQKYSRLTPEALAALYAHADLLLSLQDQRETGNPSG